jgi:hypothetical protein
MCFSTLTQESIKETFTHASEARVHESVGRSMKVNVGQLIDTTASADYLLIDPLAPLVGEDYCSDLFHSPRLPCRARFPEPKRDPGSGTTQRRI